jgi:hypothetical protein
MDNIITTRFVRVYHAGFRLPLLPMYRVAEDLTTNNVTMQVTYRPWELHLARAATYSHEHPAMCQLSAW